MVSLNVAWIVTKWLGLSTQDATDAMDTTCAGYDIYVGNKYVSVGAIALPSWAYTYYITLIFPRISGFP